MYINNLVTRFPNGISNREVGDIFNSFLMPDPTKYHIFFEDFDYYLAAHWTHTDVGAATQALEDGNGGLLLLTNAAADNNSSFAQKVGESFLFELGKPAFFRARLAVSDAVESDFIVGLQITDATPLDASDGVWFQKDDGDAEIDFHAAKNSVLVSAENVATMVSAEQTEFAFFWDGISRVWYSVAGTTLGYIDPGASLPDDEALTLSFGIQNGEAVAKTMTVDYVFAAMER